MRRRPIEAPPESRSPSATTLSVFPSPRSRDGAGPAREPGGPEVARCRVDGMPCLLIHWSPEEWARVPEARRPRHAFHGSQGGWYAFAVAD